jgi:galactose oxidase
MKGVFTVNGFDYLPRQDEPNHGNIGQHEILVSTDNVNFERVAYGTWLDDKTHKIVAFEPRPAQYVRLVAITEAGNRAGWASAAELRVFEAKTETASYAPPAQGLGKWGPTINFPIVPVAAAVEHDSGNVLAWSAWDNGYFGSLTRVKGRTQTATFSPASGLVTARSVTETQHDMFCPGINLGFDGNVFVTGGKDGAQTSIFDLATDAWTAGTDMTTARGYQSSLTLSDGKTFTIGGSWSGGASTLKNGEVYDPATKLWTPLPGCLVEPMLTADLGKDDKRKYYSADNHAMLFAWKNQTVFQAGPSKAMNWYDTTGTGSQSAAGLRAKDDDAMSGTATMYDAVAGKILVFGGAGKLQRGKRSSSCAHVITLNDAKGAVNVTKVQSAKHARAFANSVVLPDGKVFISGGKSKPVRFSDADATLTPEIWDPATEKFTELQANTIPRTYHSLSLLLPDATVFTAGGGLCGGCKANHYDAQIFTPPYLLHPDGTPAVRPVIDSVSAPEAALGTTLVVRTNSPVGQMSLVRYGSATHSVNTDQRRVPLQMVAKEANTYEVTIPNDAGVVTPGYWMLFALCDAGVPSVAKTVKITPGGVTTY